MLPPTLAGLLTQDQNSQSAPMTDPLSAVLPSTSQWPPSLPMQPPSPALNVPPKLLSFSDELLLMIVQHLDRHTDVPSTRLACRKLNALVETYFFRNVMITLPEEVIDDKWQFKLRLMPSQVTKIKQFTVLNQRKIPGGDFYEKTICQPHSHRLLRWANLEDKSISANNQFSKAACLVGVQFYPKLGKFAKRQLTAFRWRHAIPLSLANLTLLLDRQAHSLQELEISMIQPPTADVLRRFQHALRHKTLPNLKSFKYHGLSHTEPLPMNRPERGGRFRMLRPLFQKFHKSIQELVLSQDHCISQVGKTPMTLGRTTFDTLCRLSDLYIDPATTSTNDHPPVTLNLTKLELGGCYVDTLFDVPVSTLPVPQVQVHLPSLQRLVLNNCYGVDSLLRKLSVRKDEIHITELGLRIGDQNFDGNGDDFDEIYDALRDFLLSFKGLEVLSVLIDGDATGLRIGKDVLTQHTQTLRAYSVAARDNEEDEDGEGTLRFVSRPTDADWSAEEISPGVLNNPPTLREYGTSLDRPLHGEYARLRYLSQFSDLRTVVIRNFPQTFPSSSDDLQVTFRRFWRNGNGRVAFDAIKTAQDFAEQIALPLYTLPESIALTDTCQDDGHCCDLVDANPENDDHSDMLAEHKQIKDELSQIILKNVAARDRALGITLESVPFSEPAKADITRDVLKQKARTDQDFREAMSKVKKGTASAIEDDICNNYRSLVQTTLGVKAPLDESKPKLRLLVIGDWTYRDQMNISGPRKWDPKAWSAHHTADIPSDIESEYDEDGDLITRDPETDTWNYQSFQLRDGFKKEYDASLLPIFFSIDWVKDHLKDAKKYQWRAKATVLDQNSTLEGQGALGDIKLLDFAYMI